MVDVATDERVKDAVPKSAGSQTLDRALAVLRLLSDGKPRTSHEVAAELGLHRSVVYRILRSFEDEDVVARGGQGRYRPGLGLLSLAQPVREVWGERARSVMADVANRVGATTIACIGQGDVVSVLFSVPPQGYGVSVAIREGTRLPWDRGAPGLVLLSMGSVEQDEPAEVALARRTGLVRTYGEPYPGFATLAVPVRTSDGYAVALGVMFPEGDVDEALAESRLREAADYLAQPAGAWEH